MTFSKLDRMLNGIERDPLRMAIVAIITLVLCVLGTIAISTIAHADEATVSWTNPTQNTDDSAIPATGPGSLTGTNIYYGICTSNNQGLPRPRRLR